VPGHTRGSACLLYRETYLFSGDHLDWNPKGNGLQAFREVCWYDWGG
jgi:glyoxylase-like metal-dependent hydrolase (beta-lactamase superfamily II)